MEHVSVLKKDVQKYLNLVRGERVIDATLGLGGHTLDILKKIGKTGELIAFEQDERNLEVARERLKDYSENITYIHDNFRYLKTRVTGQVDAILFDLGLSSPHVDDKARGFSFMQDGPLDMRFDPRQELTAAQIINTYPEPELAQIFWRYGEEKYSRRLAKMICEKRRDKPFETTTELAEAIKATIRVRDKKHPATRVFQALRIAVNDELAVLEEALAAAFDLLKKDGRLVVISYHSLEDRIVKNFFREWANPPVESAEEAIYRTHGEPKVEILTKKPVTPSEDEILENPRSRSALLRACRKII